MPDSFNEAAAYGTAGHLLAATCLQNGKDADFYLGQRIEVSPTKAWFMIPLQNSVSYTMEFAIDIDMVAWVQTYIDAIRMKAAGGSMYVERKLNTSPIIGVDDQFGTSDAVIVNQRVLYVDDLKSGVRKRIFVRKTRQLVLYALAAYEELSMVEDIDEVCLTIHQPRLDHVDEWSMPVDELLAMAEQFAEAAQDALSDTPTVVPGESQCEWCRAKAAHNDDGSLRCQAHAAFVEQTIDAAFEVLDGLDPKKDARPMVTDLANDSTLAFEEAYAAVPMIEAWCSAMHEQALASAMAGDLTRYKAVSGRKGNRTWGDDTKAEAAMKGARLRKEEMFSMKLITPPQAEKLLAKEKPKVWKRLEAMVVQPDGKPTVVPIDDERPALSNKQEAAEFDDLTGQVDDGSDLV